MTPATTDSKPVVLHLCGSVASEYYEGVSVYYAWECVKTVRAQGTYEHRIARVHLDGRWSFPKGLEKPIDERVSMIEALQIIQDMKPCAVNPIMFCLPGMTSFRALLEDSMKIPLIGCNAHAMALSTNKAQTRAVVAAAGVKVPEAQLLRRKDATKDGPYERPTMSPPVVLKPCNEDNSQGITLVTQASQLDSAVETAFKFDTEVLCERFVELGKEIRCAVLECEDGGLEFLPCLEYYLTKDHPVRAANDKLKSDTRGIPTEPNTGPKRGYSDLEPTLLAKLRDLCERSHRALGCRDYSLYDVRVDPNGEPYLLEACLYCSFAPKSIIVDMAKQQGTSHQELFERMVERARSRAESTKGKKLLGMAA